MTEFHIAYATGKNAVWHRSGEITCPYTEAEERGAFWAGVKDAQGELRADADTEWDDDR